MLFRSILIFSFSLCFQFFTQAQEIDTLVQVDSHKLHFKIIKGTGTPILFESGNGDNGNVWDALLADIHEATGATLITYDRAGLGKSSLDSARISFKQEVKDLGTALKGLGYDSELFIVAHSFGSFYASAFTRSADHAVKGAVFIDVATPCAFDVAYATKVKNAITPALWKVIKQYKKGLYYVLQDLPETAEYMTDQFMPGTVPLMVIAAGIREPNSQIGETQVDMTEFTQCLESLGNRPGNKFILVKEAEHKVWAQAPELVKKQIIEHYQKTVQER